MAAAELCAIGVYGLSVMGQNLALNIAQNAGVRTAVGNRSHEKVVATVERAAKEGGLPIFGFKTAAEFVAGLAKPRAVIILVQAGKAVDDTIAVRAGRGLARKVGALRSLCGGRPSLTPASPPPTPPPATLAPPALADPGRAHGGGRPHH